jgi:hypothetical protein
MRLARHMARMGASRDACTILVRRPKQVDYLEYLAVDGKIVFMWIFKKRYYGSVRW